VLTTVPLSVQLKKEYPALAEAATVTLAPQATVPPPVVEPAPAGEPLVLTV